MKEGLKIITLEKSTNIKNIIKKKKNLILLFGKNNCSPCHVISEKISEWETLHKNISFIYAPADLLPDLAAQCGFFTFPSVVVYIDSKLVIRESRNFSINKILSKTEYYLNLLNESD